MKELLVSVERNGSIVPVGKIIGESPSDARFQYSDEYRLDGGTPISISLPHGTT